MSPQDNGPALALPLMWTGTAEPAEQSASPVPLKAEPSDESLMSLLQARDSRALEFLFKRYSGLVFGIALRILRSRGESEDIVQEVFVYIYQRPALFDPRKGSAKSWIVQIAFSRALDRRAHLARRAYYSGTNVELLEDTLVGTSDLEREVEARLNRFHLERAFEDLPPLQRRTLEMFYFEGLALREISERLVESLGNVRHHFYRGLERLRKNALVQGLRERPRR